MQVGGRSVVSNLLTGGQVYHHQSMRFEYKDILLLILLLFDYSIGIEAQDMVADFEGEILLLTHGETWRLWWGGLRRGNNRCLLGRECWPLFFRLEGVWF